jgi:hypothetical protein
VLAVSEDEQEAARAVARTEALSPHAPPVRPQALSLSARLTLVVELVD